MDQALLDQLHAARFPLPMADSVDSLSGDFYRLAPGGEFFFSEQAQREGGSSVPPVAQRWLDHSIGADDWGVSLLTLGILLLYCWLAYRYRKAIATSLKAALSLEDTFMVFDHMPHEFSRFLSLSRLLVLSSVALLLCLVPVWSPSAPVAGGQVLVWWGGVLLYLYGSLGIQRVMLWLVACFDAVPDRLLMLGKLNQLDWAMVAVFFPLVVVLVLGLTDLWLVALGLFGLAVGVHWVRLFIYFKWAGFSIVQWFLYLCTLEVLPFTLLWGVGRGLGVFY